MNDSDRRALEPTFREVAISNGAPLTNEQLGQLFIFIGSALRWNARIQLTATRDAVEFGERHVADSLHVVGAVPGGARRLVDVGSGGGLPGVILAIALPEVSVTLLEPVHKKRAFLAAVRRELALENLEAIAVRDEDHDPGAGYDVAVARAVWAVDEWLERGQRLVRPGGLVVAMEGREQGPLPPGVERRPYELAGGRKRALAIQTRA